MTMFHLYLENQIGRVAVLAERVVRQELVLCRPLLEVVLED
jgi:hypothetical protein